MSGSRLIGFVFIILVLLGAIDCGRKKKSQQAYDPSTDSIVTMLTNVLTAGEIEEGWLLLFDGISTDGWRGFRSDSVGRGWVVENSCLTALGLGDDMSGDIITVGQFGDFEMVFEWNISQGGNSGVMYHVVEKDFPAAYASGPEYQIIDDIGFPEKLEPWQTTGANYALHSPVNARVKPVGEFNTSRIIVHGNHVEHWLNGEMVVRFEQWTDEWKELVKNSKWKDYPDYGMAKKGHIALQDHGSKICFRNIKIRPLN